MLRMRQAMRAKPRVLRRSARRAALILISRISPEIDHLHGRIGGAHHAQTARIFGEKLLADLRNHAVCFFFPLACLQRFAQMIQQAQFLRLLPQFLRRFAAFADVFARRDHRDRLPRAVFHHVGHQAHRENRAVFAHVHGFPQRPQRAHVIRAQRMAQFRRRKHAQIFPDQLLDRAAVHGRFRRVDIQNFPAHIRNCDAERHLFNCLPQLPLHIRRARQRPRRGSDCRVPRARRKRGRRNLFDGGLEPAPPLKHRGAQAARRKERIRDAPRMMEDQQRDPYRSSKNRQHNHRHPRQHTPSRDMIVHPFDSWTGYGFRGLFRSF